MIVISCSLSDAMILKARCGKMCEVAKQAAILSGRKKGGGIEMGIKGRKRNLKMNGPNQEKGK